MSNIVSGQCLIFPGFSWGDGWERRPSPADNPMAMAFRTKSKAACGHRPTRGNNPATSWHVRHAHEITILLDTMLQCHVQKLQRKILWKTSGNHDMPWLSLGQCLSCMCRQGREDSRPFVKEIPKRSYNGSTATWRAANALRLHAVDVSFWFIYIYNIIYIIYTYVWGVQLHLLAPLHEFVHDMLALSKPCRSCSQYQLGAKTSLRLWGPGVSPSWTNNSSEEIIYTKYEKWLNNIGKYGTQLARYGYYILFVSSWFFLHDVTVHPKASCSMRQPALNTASMTSAGSSGSMLQTLAFRSNFSPETWPSSLMSYDVFDILFRATLAQPAQTWQWPWHGKTLACHPKTAWLPHSTLLSSFEKGKLAWFWCTGTRGTGNLCCLQSSYSPCCTIVHHVCCDWSILTALKKTETPQKKPVCGMALMLPWAPLASSDHKTWLKKNSENLSNYWQVRLAFVRNELSVQTKASSLGLCQAFHDAEF